MKGDGGQLLRGGAGEDTGRECCPIEKTRPRLFMGRTTNAKKGLRSSGSGRRPLFPAAYSARVTLVNKGTSGFFTPISKDRGDDERGRSGRMKGKKQTPSGGGKGTQQFPQRKRKVGDVGRCYCCRSGAPRLFLCLQRRKEMRKDLNPPVMCTDTRVFREKITKRLTEKKSPSRQTCRPSLRRSWGGLVKGTSASWSGRKTCEAPGKDRSNGANMSQAPGHQGKLVRVRGGKGKKG